MKRSVLVFILIGLVFTVGCGRDGSRGRDGSAGRVYIAYEWLFDPFYYSSNDPGIPNNVINETFYETAPGTYTISYIAWDSSQWQYAYTITANPGSRGQEGEKGSFPFQNGRNGRDGDDGAPKYHKLLCYSIGASFYYRDWSAFSKASFDHFYDDKFNREISKHGNDLLPLAVRSKFKGIKIK